MSENSLQKSNDTFSYRLRFGFRFSHPWVIAFLLIFSRKTKNLAELRDFWDYFVSKWEPLGNWKCVLRKSAKSPIYRSLAVYRASFFQKSWRVQHENDVLWSILTSENHPFFLYEKIRESRKMTFCYRDDISENWFFYQKRIYTLEFFDRLWYNYSK